MNKALVFGPAIVALSASAAWAQVYVTPGYGYGYAAPLYDSAAPAYGYGYGAPTYVAPAPVYAAPATQLHPTATQLQPMPLWRRPRSTRRQPCGGPAIMIMHPDNLGVPRIWSVVIARPGITVTETRAASPRLGQSRRGASRNGIRDLPLRLARDREGSRQTSPGQSCSGREKRPGDQPTHKPI